MTIAFWCVLVAAFLPFPFTLAAKWSRRFDNHHPRDYLDRVEGWRRRAHATQLNSFEAFPAFAAAVIINRIVAGPNAVADALALSFIGFRVAYGLLYIANLATLRSVAWFGGAMCCVALFVTAA
jgi:uncharacterized MAPEG superfamily protein